MFAMYGFHLENVFWKKFYLRSMQFVTILLCYMKSKLMRREQLEITYLLTIFLSIPLNKLLCFEPSGNSNSTKWIMAVKDRILALSVHSLVKQSNSLMNIEENTR